MMNFLNRAQKFYPHLELVSILLGVVAVGVGVLQYVSEAQSRDSVRRALVLTALDSCQNNMRFSFNQEEDPIHTVLGHIVELRDIRSACARVTWDFAQIVNEYTREDERAFVEATLEIYNSMEWGDNGAEEQGE